MRRMLALSSPALAYVLLWLSSPALAYPPSTPFGSVPASLTNASGYLQIDICYLTADSSRHVGAVCLDPHGRATIPYSEWCADLLALSVPAGSSIQDKEALPAVIDCRHLVVSRFRLRSSAGDTNKIEIKGSVLAIEYLTGPSGILQAEVVVSDSAASQGGGAKQLVLQCGQGQLSACADPGTLLPCGGGGTLTSQEAGPSPGSFWTIQSCANQHTYGACIKVTGGLLPFGDSAATTPFVTNPIQLDTACSTPPA